MRTRILWCLGFATLAACGPKTHIADKNKALERLADADEIGFGFELQPACALQKNASQNKPGEKGWAGVEAKSLTNKTFKVIERITMTPVENGHERISVALKLMSVRTNDVMWLRNTPASSAEEATKRWSCAFDKAVIAKALPTLKAPVVELSVASQECLSIAPIFGDVTNLTFSPYTVTGRTLFATKKGPVVGVRLEAEGGEKALTVPARTLERCFVPADHPPPPPEEARQLAGWLRTGGPPPNVSADTARIMTGLQLENCLKEGSGLTTHLECRMPILRIEAEKEAGPYGPPTIRLERDRFVDAVHLYAKRLIATSDVVTVNAAVRLRGSSPAVAKAFNVELEKTLVDAASKQRRAENAFRLLRATDVAAGVPASHWVDIELAFNIPEVAITTETRTHKYVAGQKTINNPKHAEAQRDVETKRRELRSAKQALESAERLAASAGDSAEELCKKGTSQAADKLPFGLGAVAGSVAGSACKKGVEKAVTSAEKSDVERKQRELEEAETALEGASRTIAVDDQRTYSYQAKVYRRSGDATARLTIASASTQAAPLLSTTVTFHFEASDFEHAASPEHFLSAKTAKTPSDEDVEHQLAASLLPRIDEAIIKWAAQRQVGGDIGDLEPGTRSWMVAVARNAASDRPVKLVSDLLETRQEELEKADLVFPVTMPKTLEKRCFTFAAIPLVATADVNLELGRVNGDSFVPYARDARSNPDAAFEVCGLPMADYAVRATFASKKISTKGVLVSMFESTPGGATNQDTIAASKGIPTKPRKGEELALNGEGIVQYRGTNNKVVTGKTGDRDGDGILDDDDRCPYDPETMNGYLDEDGCPDVPPAGAAAEKTKGTP